MSRLLDSGLEQLMTHLSRMGEIAEKTVGLSFEGFMHNEDAAQHVRELSEMLVAMTTEVEEKAFQLIVKYQPVSSDLRIINSYMKIAYDLERYGRYAWDISLAYQKAPRDDDCISAQKNLEGIMSKVIDMVRTSIRALRDFDVELAKNLATLEKEVDEMYQKYIDFLADTHISARCMICNVLVVRYLERLADHAAYVGEGITYIATGEKILLR